MAHNGQPEPTKERITRVTVAFSPTELEYIKRMCDENQIPAIATMIRALVIREARRTGLDGEAGGTK
jgi:hypothetical protein